MGTDLDFDRFGVLGAGEGLVRQAALGALFLAFGQIVGLLDLGEVVMGATSRTGIFVLLATRPFSAAGGRRFLGAVLLFGLLAKQLVFELCHSGTQCLDLPLLLGFPLFGTLELRSPIVGLLAFLEQLQQQPRRILKQFLRRPTRNGD